MKEFNSPIMKEFAKTQKRLENDLMNECIKYLKLLGIDYYHAGYRGLHKHGHSKNVVGWPDLFIFHNGVTRFVELKQKGKGLKPEQTKKIEFLVENGFDCYVIDNFEAFKECLRW